MRWAVGDAYQPPSSRGRASRASARPRLGLIKTEESRFNEARGYPATHNKRASSRHGENSRRRNCRRHRGGALLMGAIKATVGIAVDIAGSVIRVVLVPLLALGIFAALLLVPSGMAHADASTETFLLGVISAVMLLGMLVAGCVAFVSQRHSASYQQGNDYAMQQAYPGMSRSISAALASACAGQGNAAPTPAASSKPGYLVPLQANERQKAENPCD